MHHPFENCQLFLTDRKYFLSEPVAYYILLIRGTSDMAAFLIRKKFSVITKSYIRREDFCWLQSSLMKTFKLQKVQNVRHLLMT